MNIFLIWLLLKLTLCCWKLATGQIKIKVRNLNCSWPSCFFLAKIYFQSGFRHVLMQLNSNLLILNFLGETSVLNRKPRNIKIFYWIPLFLNSWNVDLLILNNNESMIDLINFLFNMIVIITIKFNVWF